MREPMAVMKPRYVTTATVAMPSDACSPMMGTRIDCELISPVHFRLSATNPTSAANERRNFPCQRRISAFEKCELADCWSETGVAKGDIVRCGQRTLCSRKPQGA